MKKVFISLILLVLWSTGNAALIDDFESYTAGFIRDGNGKPPWTDYTGGTSYAKIYDFSDNKVLNIGHENLYRGAYIAVPPVDNLSQVVMTARFYIVPGTTNDSSDRRIYFGLSDEAVPGTDSDYYSRFEVQLGIRQLDGEISIMGRNGGEYIFDLAPLETGRWYTIAVEIDQNTDTFDAYLTDESADPALAVKVISEFGFRNGTTSDLISFAAWGRIRPSLSLYFDDIDISPLDLTRWAQNPSPENNAPAVDSQTVNTLSWDPPTTLDPNVLSITGYDVYFSDVDADFTGEDPDSLTETSKTVTLEYGKDYFWRVDTRIVSDSVSYGDVIKGRSWTFTTMPSNLVPVVDAGNDIVVALHSVPAELNTASITDDDETVTVEWEITGYPGISVVKEAAQMIDRGGNDGTFDPDFLRDWIGTDARNSAQRASEPLVITLTGLPAGTYTWTSYHHDPEDQTSLIDMAVKDADGSEFFTDIDISNGSAADPGDITTAVAAIVSNGTDPVKVLFESAADSFVVINGFDLAGISGDPLLVDFGTSGSAVKTGYQSYIAVHETFEPDTFTFAEQDYNALGGTIAVQAAWGFEAADIAMSVTGTNSDHTAPTAEFTADYPGIYQVKLTATDLLPQSASDTMTIYVGADSCSAAQDSPDWSGFNHYDRNNDCIVDFGDFADFASEWFKDINLKEQVELD